MSAIVMGSTASSVPSNTGFTSAGSYTVPAGKYARVNIAAAMLPSVNATALWNTKTIFTTTNILQTSTLANGSYPLSCIVGNVHRLNFRVAVGLCYVMFHQSSAGGGSVVGISPSLSVNTGSPTSWAFQSPTNVNGLYYIPSGGNYYISEITADSYVGTTELWLKPGDTLTWTVGTITYAEYSS